MIATITSPPAISWRAQILTSPAFPILRPSQSFFEFPGAYSSTLFKP
jgi:hypothetical protein